ncbi:S8 family serine peptidase [Sunxiuqinia rutila]|uniref:S8 family serine peptidase n=1 Tax=Sunxiuqinia rutila TaxID=1397841 RepID=UPI003D360A35
MNRFIHSILFILIASSSNAGSNKDSVQTAPLSHWAIELMQSPKLKASGQQPIVVAVIDDGFLLSHKSLQNYLFTNEKEIPGNGIDDDNNGFIDDYCGWDVSDNNANVTIPQKEYAKYYHGTFISSLITQLASASYEASGETVIKILPIKALSDNAQATYIKDGYRGIEYAMHMGADIICCAWSGGSPTSDEQQIINKALAQNILIVAAAGNMYQEKVDPPASFNGVYAIAALDTLLQKTQRSNYGIAVDLSLPGQKVRGAYPLADNAWFYGQGTSAATGLATGCAAILKSVKPEASPWEIMEALKNTATPLDYQNRSYSGKLGSGLPNLLTAVDYLLNPDKRSLFFAPERPEGAIYLNKSNSSMEWTIKPEGTYRSVVIIPDQLNKQNAQKTLRISSQDSVYFNGKIEALKAGISIQGSEASIQVRSHKRKDFPNGLKLNYYVETIDSSRLFCDSKVYLEANEGTLSDNSGNQHYANNSTCSWQLSAPDSKRIQFNFSEFNTEAKVDFVWLFDGDYAQPSNIIAKFSGNDIPPQVSSRTNRVFIWFVTNNEGTDNGWTLEFKGLKE